MSSGIIDKNGIYLNRRSTRLKGYDYTKQGSYYITICTDNRENVFGEIIDGKMTLNKFGEIANSCWNAIPEHFPNVDMDEYVVMPNHVHGIIIINNSEHNIVGAGLAPALNKNNNSAQNNIYNIGKIKLNKYDINTNRATARVAPTIGNIVSAYKSIVANECLKLFKMNNQRMGKIWQRNYYDRIIRNNDELKRVREYIMNNPAKWDEDEYNMRSCSSNS